MPGDTEPPGCPGKESESTYQSASVNVEILKPIDKQRQRTNVEHRRISINHLAGRARYVTGGFASRGFLEHTKFNTDVALLASVRSGGPTYEKISNAAGLVKIC